MGYNQIMRDEMQIAFSEDPILENYPNLNETIEGIRVRAMVNWLEEKATEGYGPL